jgi:hypothetical protein
MYFVVDCEEPVTEDGEALFEIHNCFRVGTTRNWRAGHALRRAETIPDLIPIDFEPLNGYEGGPVELIDVCIPLMSARLAEALKSAGVDNVVFYPARLTNTATGQTYDYQAFNVVGIVAAADLEKSEWSTFDGMLVADVSFTELALDESSAGGMLLFRLAENINALLVHHSVRDHVLAAGIDTLQFIPPEEWMHL